MPILAECTEPLAEGVVDMRGLWHGVAGRVRHLERIEQCGNRVVVTTSGLIHDFRVDGTLENGARDVGMACNNFNTAIHFDEQGVMASHPVLVMVDQLAVATSSVSTPQRTLATCS